MGSTTLNQERNSLSLSNGEQNFISLAFELLKAKKSNAKIKILDDPISSFDSIFKNKITYSIIKFLEGQNQIILTHSTELIKLLEHQKNGCFNLYMINNTNGEENGFIQINKNEQSILLYLHKFLDLLRSGLDGCIINEKLFIISLVPFMRGFAQIINDIESKNKLTKVMHGYETESINLSEIYNKLFGANLIKNEHVLSANDIIILNIDSNEIINKLNFPLLNKTLRHTLTYLYLRLSVEKHLVSKYSINTNQCETLSKIIIRAFSGTNQEIINKRVFLLSRKTLLNEFNHFEIDLNIFQPAIDITDSALRKERKDILQFLNSN